MTTTEIFEKNKNVIQEALKEYALSDLDIMIDQLRKGQTNSASAGIFEDDDTYNTLCIIDDIVGLEFKRRMDITIAKLKTITITTPEHESNRKG